MRHIHLDLVGGIAGDMFSAALLDGWPELAAGLLPALRAAGLKDDVAVRWEPVQGEVLAGTRFVVDDPRERDAPRPPHHHVLAQGAHAHVPFTDVRATLERAPIAPGVRARALDIFLHLARAEASVHGLKDVDAVVFHEVGAMDSVADIVSAAFLIEGLGVASWSSSPVPLGSGQVMTAHGALPVPAPATQRLLEGMRVVDDGRPGERCTPTGAAILRHLAPSAARPAGVLGKAGIGWGTKRFPGLPNVVRALEIALLPTTANELVSRIAFEIDDQPAEDLAVALDHLRAHDGVLDVLQAPAFGKKGRMVAQVRVLCSVDVEDAVVRACLLETTTLGVRVQRVTRHTLPRDAAVVGDLRVKTTRRPDGTITKKVEMQDLESLPSARARAQVRRRAEDE